MRVLRGRGWAGRLLPALIIALSLAGIVSAHAFTLISARTTLSVRPNQGLPTATYTVVGQYLLGQCPPPTSQVTVTFIFYWDKSVSNTPIWTKTVSTCTVSPPYYFYDSGSSPRLLPPSGRSSPGQHTLEVDVINAATGGMEPNGTQSANYTILAPGPSPTPTPSPRRSPTPPPCYAEGHARACPSPSAASCTNPPTAALPPVSSGGETTALIFGGLLAGGLPIGGAAMVIFPGFRLRRDQLNRLAALLGLSALLLLTTQCVFKPSGQTRTSPSPVAAVNSAVGFEVTPDCRGYWMASTNGGIFPFGNAAGFGSAGGDRLNQPIVDVEATPDGGGYWLVAADGGIFPFGDAAGFGSTGGIHLSKPIVAMENTPDGGGYWLVASDGGIFPFGNAAGYGSTGSIRLNQPIVDMEATPDGAGYWLVAADGGIFPFGDAAGYASTGDIHINKPIVGMETTPDGAGYWLVASDGGVFPFGDAAGYGSTGGVHLNSPIVGMEATPDGHGYWLFAADGGVFPFGDAPGLGSAAGHI